MPVRVLFIGEIVGKPGVFCIKKQLPQLRADLEVDLVIANADGATGGFGIGKNHAVYLHKLGVDVITTGDQAYFKKDIVGHFDSASYMLRPANYPPGNPGRGWRVFRAGEQRVAVISMVGMSGSDRSHPTNPFTYLPELVGRAKKDTPIVVVDFHAVTTAEKATMAHMATGHVSALLGTGTRVRTADARIMGEKTAVITDVGRTGSRTSVGGLDPGPEIEKFLTQMPIRSSDVWDDLMLQGVLVEIDDDGAATGIRIVEAACEGGEHDRTSSRDQN